MKTTTLLVFFSLMVVGSKILSGQNNRRLATDELCVRKTHLADGQKQSRTFAGPIPSLKVSPPVVRSSFRWLPTGFRDTARSLSIRSVSERDRSGVVRTQRLKTDLLRTQSSKVLPLKPGAGQYIAKHATPAPKISSLQISTFLVPTYPTCIFPKPLPSFSCVGCN